MTAGYCGVCSCYEISSCVTLKIWSQIVHSPINEVEILVLLCYLKFHANSLLSFYFKQIRVLFVYKDILYTTLNLLNTNCSFFTDLLCDLEV